MLRSQRFRSLVHRFIVASKIARRASLAVALASVARSDAHRRRSRREVLIGDAVSDPGTRYADVDEAIKRFTNRDPLGAQQFLEAALRKNPNSAAGRLAVGQDVHPQRRQRVGAGIARKDGDGQSRPTPSRI